MRIPNSKNSKDYIITTVYFRILGRLLCYNFACKQAATSAAVAAAAAAAAASAAVAAAAAAAAPLNA